MFSQPRNISFHLPDWIDAYTQTYQPTTDVNERMLFVIAASRKNVEEGTGGPFAAAIFETHTGRLVSLGVNLVATLNLSFLHAEMVATAIAQTKLNTYDLGDPALPALELFATTEPCAMCLGAIPWSGVSRVITAAKDVDARDIGFDEGTKPDNWKKCLNDRGIEVIDNIEAQSAKTVLQLYSQQNGDIYNTSQD
jgi:tRNA(Arg) A34 adenosine deaminase TadA